ncbi:hypothetical protein ADUPG1_001250, partial [Aduncisulcus paluster]
IDSERYWKQELGIHYSRKDEFNQFLAACVVFDVCDIYSFRAAEDLLLDILEWKSGETHRTNLVVMLVGLSHHLGGGDSSKIQCSLRKVFPFHGEALVKRLNNYVASGDVHPGLRNKYFFMYHELPQVKQTPSSSTTNEESNRLQLAYTRALLAELVHKLEKETRFGYTEGIRASYDPFEKEWSSDIARVKSLEEGEKDVPRSSSSRSQKGTLNDSVSRVVLKTRRKDWEEIDGGHFLRRIDKTLRLMKRGLHSIKAECDRAYSLGWKSIIDNPEQDEKIVSSSLLFSRNDAPVQCNFPKYFNRSIIDTFKQLRRDFSECRQHHVFAGSWVSNNPNEGEEYAEHFFEDTPQVAHLSDNVCHSDNSEGAFRTPLDACSMCYFFDTPICLSEISVITFDPISEDNQYNTPGKISVVCFCRERAIPYHFQLQTPLEGVYLAHILKFPCTTKYVEKVLLLFERQSSSSRSVSGDHWISSNVMHVGLWERMKRGDMEKMKMKEKRIFEEMFDHLFPKTREYFDSSTRISEDLETHAKAMEDIR